MNLKRKRRFSVAIFTTSRWKYCMANTLLQKASPYVADSRSILIVRGHNILLNNEQISVYIILHRLRITAFIPWLYHQQISHIVHLLFLVKVSHIHYNSAWSYMLRTVIIEYFFLFTITWICSIIVPLLKVKYS